MKPAPNKPPDPGKIFEFTPRDFARVRALIYRQAGISLSEGKHEMVYSRLARRLRARGMNSFAEYLDSLENGTDDSEEWVAFTNALTTNLTAFFREAHHFPVLAEHLRGRATPLSIWCSASSTGEEPYSIAMTACEVFGTLTPPVTIVATDIDTNVLQTAANGVYPMERVEKMERERLKHFFQRGKGAQSGMVRVRPELRQLVTFQPLNLLAPSWALNGPFDAIFCRNVMIYFDAPTKARLIERYTQMIKLGGWLYIGHSESLLGAHPGLELIGRTVYRRV